METANALDVPFSVHAWLRLEGPLFGLGQWLKSGLCHFVPRVVTNFGVCTLCLNGNRASPRLTPNSSRRVHLPWPC